MAQWVQHKSGAGEKWKVINTRESAWLVQSPKNEQVNWDLPKSEYIPCEPPEQWEEVAVTIREEPGHSYCLEAISADGKTVASVRVLGNGYRVTSLVVERRRTA